MFKQYYRMKKKVHEARETNNLQTLNKQDSKF